MRAPQPARPTVGRAIGRAGLALFATLCSARVRGDDTSALVSLRGVVDLHCHSGPDTVRRALSDLQLARLARDAGMRAIVLKNHHTMTADRAQLVMSEVRGIEVFGGVVLNRAVGGLNPDAVQRMVEMEGRRGKIVWLPTIDAENQVRFSREERAAIPVVRGGKPVPELAAVLDLIARHDLVLATGHASADESLVLIPAARQAGVKRFLVTHVLAEAVRATPAKLRQLADLGAFLECTWLTHSPGSGGAINVGRPVPIADTVGLVRAVGAQHVILASDLGQYGNPSHPDGMRDFITALVAAGVAADEIDVMVRRNPARLLGLDP